MGQGQQCSTATPKTDQLLHSTYMILLHCYIEVVVCSIGTNISECLHYIEVVVCSVGTNNSECLHYIDVVKVT